MHGKVVLAILLSCVVILIDLRFYFLVRSLLRTRAKWIKVLIYGMLIGSTTLILGVIGWYNLASFIGLTKGLNQMLMTVIMTVYSPKILSVLVMLPFDVRRVAMAFFKKMNTDKGTEEAFTGKVMTRSEFVEKLALGVGGLPFAASVFGITYGAYDYEVRRVTLSLPNLPAGFDGIRLGHFADAHVSEHVSTRRFGEGIDLMMKEKADIVCFTGDLVNYRTSEAANFADILRRVRAPYGVFSITGNHDYGEYISWSSLQEKEKNFQDFILLNKEMGYQLLLNENRKLSIGSDSIGIVGVENWGTGRFPKYGKLDLATQGLKDTPVTILLSHDPSHWDAQVRPEYPGVDLMLAGHTHGFQMGVQLEQFQWSPAQYMYRQWAGLYQEGSQYLYVNRGFGCLGYLGRVGMPPEITVIELKKA